VKSLTGAPLDRIPLRGIPRVSLPVRLNDMKITYDLSEEDYKTFFRFHYSQNKIMKFRPYYGSLMVIIGWYLNRTMAWSRREETWAFYIIVFGS
jgi:hypothetical protein